MSAMAMFAVQRGIQTQQAVVDAFTQQAMAELQVENIDRQMDEIKARTRMQIQEIYDQAENVQSEQTAAYIKGGVEISGSAMSVLNDTLNNAAQSAFIRQREADYSMIDLSMQKAAYNRQASDMNLYMNIASSLATGATGLAGDYYSSGRYGSRDRKPMGSTGNQSARNYQQGTAQGIS